MGGTGVAWRRAGAQQPDGLGQSGGGGDGWRAGAQQPDGLGQSGGGGDGWRLLRPYASVSMAGMAAVRRP
jgi:hypothetical protein